MAASGRRVPVMLIAISAALAGTLLVITHGQELARRSGPSHSKSLQLDQAPSTSPPGVGAVPLGSNLSSRQGSVPSAGGSALVAANGSGDAAAFTPEDSWTQQYDSDGILSYRDGLFSQDVNVPRHFTSWFTETPSDSVVFLGTNPDRTSLGLILGLNHEATQLDSLWLIFPYESKYTITSGLTFAHSLPWNLPQGRNATTLTRDGSTNVSLARTSNTSWTLSAQIIQGKQSRSGIEDGQLELTTDATNAPWTGVRWSVRVKANGILVSGTIDLRRISSP